MARSLRWSGRVRALCQLLKKATACGRWWEWAAQSICEWARRGVREWAKTAFLDATPKTPTPIAFTTNLFHRMGGLRKGNDGPDVFGCDRSVRGIDFLAASGFKNVSVTGVLT
jgi:hypothetical protein